VASAYFFARKNAGRLAQTPLQGAVYFSTKDVDDVLHLIDA
jgi:hypothetical protein